MAPSVEEAGREGWWGTPTSSIDWCEDNYQVTDYVAEFWNTVSNLSMIVPACYGLWSVRKEALETRFHIIHCLFLLVGVGSTLFHMTLKHSMQVLDEVPMIWGSCYMVYTMHMLTAEPGAISLTAAALLAGYSLTFALVYLLVPIPAIFQAMYGTVVIGMIIQAAVCLRRLRNPDATKLYFGSFLCYLAGFILWNLDNHTCPTLQYIRAALPPFLRPFIQLHAWWHLLAGYATYLNILHALHQRLTHLRKAPSIAPAFPVGLTVTSRRQSRDRGEKG